MYHTGAFEDIDWNAMWRTALLNSSFRKLRKGLDSATWWDSRAKQFGETARRSRTAGEIIAKLPLEAGLTVLDVGAGTGRLAVPIAKKVKKVTAVEPSASMLAYLKQYATEERVTNISLINKKWEEVELDADLDEHDIVIACHSLSMEDIYDALLKLHQAAKQSVFLCAFARRESWLTHIWPNIFNEPYRAGPTHIYLVNALYALGIHANVEVMDVQSEREFPDLDTAVKYATRLLSVSDAQSDRILRGYLSEKVRQENGKLKLSQQWKRAMIWWQKKEHPEE